MESETRSGRIGILQQAFRGYCHRQRFGSRRWCSQMITAWYSVRMRYWLSGNLRTVTGVYLVSDTYWFADRPSQLTLMRKGTSE